MSGPLASLKIVEFAGLGPAPLAGQLLADLGADVVVIDRISGESDPADINRRGKKSIALNLKTPKGLQVAKRLIAASDVLIEGFRPGVMERLGLGPKDCPETLVYGRMTGWGQEGPLAHSAGHDITYLAMTGALHAIGPADRPPVVPLNLIADFGGGTMFLLYGILAALIERGISGKGQVVDAAMVDGVPAMMGLVHSFIAQGQWQASRESNWLDGASHFYRCYECADNKFIAVGALEPQFYAELVKLSGVKGIDVDAQFDRARWPEQQAIFAEHFKTKPRDEWADIFTGTDACVAPVLDFDEAARHPANQARHAYFTAQGVTQASPAPRFERSRPTVTDPPHAPGQDSENILAALGYNATEIDAMREKGAIT